MLDQLRALTPREAAREILRAYARNDLLTYASAIAFQIAFALIPFMLFALGVMGGLGLQDVWGEHVVPHLRESLSPPAFELIDDTARTVLSHQQTFWITAGAVITVWEISGGVRAVMGVFDRIYECERKRSAKERYLVSISLAAGCGLLILAAVALVDLVPLWVHGPLALLRWPLAIMALLATVALLVRFAPADAQSAGWVSFGSSLVVLAWMATSIAFATYVTKIADYNSIFGALSVAIVAFEYLYLSAAAFLTGAQLDALVRERLEGDASGERTKSPSKGSSIAPAAADTG
jgi:membrane protein